MELQKKVISREIHKLLYDSNKTLATAESCTGGRIAESIMATPGSSSYFKGGVISYTDDIKTEILGVSAQLINDKTAVCEEVALQMLKGICEKFKTDFAIAVTGYAGPGGGTDQIPVGTIWIACGTKEKQVTLKLSEDEGRDHNLQCATIESLKLFLSFIKESGLIEEEADSEEIL